MPVYLQITITVCAVAALAGMAFAQFTKGGRGESGDIIKFYKEQAENYKEMCEAKDTKHSEEIKAITTDFNSKFNNLSKEFGILQGQYNAEKASRERAEEILKDRNPETAKFMELMINAANNQTVVNEKVTTILESIYTMAKAEHERDFNITATVTKGN